MLDLHTKPIFNKLRLSPHPNRISIMIHRLGLEVNIILSCLGLYISYRKLTHCSKMEEIFKITTVTLILWCAMSNLIPDIEFIKRLNESDG